MVKFRASFISNSSTSSYVCMFCDKEVISDELPDEWLSCNKCDNEWHEKCEVKHSKKIKTAESYPEITTICLCDADGAFLLDLGRIIQTYHGGDEAYFIEEFKNAGYETSICTVCKKVLLKDDLEDYLECKKREEGAPCAECRGTFVSDENLLKFVIKEDYGGKRDQLIEKYRKRKLCNADEKTSNS